MKATVNFCYEKKPIEIQCTNEEEMKKIFSRYAIKLNSNENNFDFFYDNKKINNDSTISKLTGNKKKNNIIVFVERKSKIIKCPNCICNDAIIKIENFRLKFDGCKYNHSDNKIFDDYEKSQEIDFSKIQCSNSNCRNNVKTEPSDFYKCIDCPPLKNRTIYYCSLCKIKHDENHKRMIKYDEKNYYCEKHCKKLIKYCEDCNNDLCEDCEGSHKDHNIKTYESMEEETRNIRDGLKNIKKSITDLEHVVENIKGFLEGSVDIMKKYCIIAEDILNKYEAYNKELKNHRILQSVINLNDSNEKVMEDINSIIKTNDIKQQAQSIINIFILDREDYIKGSKNNINILKNSNGNIN